MVKVGDMIFPVIFKPLANPWAKVVLPAPKSPVSAKTIPCFNAFLPKLFAKFCVFATEPDKYSTMEFYRVSLRLAK